MEEKSRDLSFASRRIEQVDRGYALTWRLDSIRTDEMHD